MKLRNWFASTLAAVVILWGTSLPSLAAGRDLAVLVVGRGNDKDLSTRERQVIEHLTKLRVQRGWNHKLLPIYSYHFDKPAEKSYCEERLKIRQSDLVVVGLVELESGVPVDFVFRENGVDRADQVAEKVMDRARAELAARGRLASTTTPPPSTSPSRPSTTSTKPTPARTSTVETPPSPTPSRPAVPPGTVAVTTTPSTPSMRPAPARPRSSSSVKPPVVKAPVVKAPVVQAPVVKAPVVKAPVVKTPPATTRPVATSPPVVKTPAVPATTPSTPAARTPAAQTTPAAATPPSTPPVAANPAVTQPSGGAVEQWAVQVAVFSTVEKARALVEKLKKENDLVAEIRKGTRDGKVVYRVVVGSFSSQAEAYAYAKTLKESGIQAFSVKIDGPVVK